MQTGVNAYALYVNGNANQTAAITLTEGEHEFACVQLQRTLMGRGDIVKILLYLYSIKQMNRVIKKFIIQHRLCH